MRDETEYKHRSIVVETDDDLNVERDAADRRAVRGVRVDIDGERIPVRVENEGFYTYLLPYYTFESPTELARKIIDLEDVIGVDIDEEG